LSRFNKTGSVGFDDLIVSVRTLAITVPRDFFDG
jgi:hypothetical protein